MSNPTSVARSARLHHRFFVATSGVLLAITFLGFAPSFFLKAVFGDPGMIVQMADLLRTEGGGKSLGVPDLPLYVVVHGLLTTAWMVIFFIQTLLITSGRRSLHQRLGVGGLVVAAGVVVSGVVALFRALPRLIALSEPPDPVIIIAEQVPSFAGDLGIFVVFAMFVGGAAYFRGRPETHKHLMLLATMTLMGPPINRFWLQTGLENAAEFWAPTMENGLMVLVIGADWMIRRRTPWVLLGGVFVVGVVYGSMFGLGSTDGVQAWALGWMA